MNRSGRRAGGRVRMFLQARQRAAIVCAFLSLAVLLVTMAGAQAAAAGSPTARVRETIDQIIGILHQQGIPREETWQRVGAVINDRFDFRSMSQSVLATNWQAASREEKRQFVEFFSQYLEDTYRTKIESHTDQRVEYAAESINGKRALVETFIVTDKSRIPVNYKLKDNDGEWFAYDVVIEGVSLVNNYRNTFDAIVRAQGMDGLLKDLEGRIANYRATRGEPPVQQ